jgi:hypothetical protein
VGVVSLRKLLLGAVSLFVLVGLRWVGTPDSDTDTIDTSRVGARAALCEQATSRLRQCCGRLDAPAIACTYRREQHIAGCSGSGTTYRLREPDFDVDESRSILETGCEDLEARGACVGAARAANP